MGSLLLRNLLFRDNLRCGEDWPLELVQKTLLARPMENFYPKGGV